MEFILEIMKDENFAKNYNFKTFNSIKEISENNEIEMVDIITPPNQRLELVESLVKLENIS